MARNSFATAKILLYLAIEITILSYSYHRTRVFKDPSSSGMCYHKIPILSFKSPKTTAINAPNIMEMNMMENLATGNMFLGRACWITKYLYTPWGIFLLTSSYTKRNKRTKNAEIKPRLSTFHF